MSGKSRLSPEKIKQILEGNEREHSYHKIARDAGVARATVVRTLSRFVGRVRKADEFEGGAAVAARQRQQPIEGWTLSSIREARACQMRGQFQTPVRLAEAMRTDDAMFTGYHSRIAPQSAVQTRLVAAPGERGEIVQRKALSSCLVSRGTLAGINGTLANHGIAIGYVTRQVSDDGDRIDMKLTEWPLEHVRYHVSTELLETSTREGVRVPIVHGDGYWIKFQKFDVQPWTQDACVLPGSLLWGAHAFGLSDWCAASKSHGQAKIVGTLPQGVSLQAKDPTSGNIVLTAEALGYLQMLQDIVSGDAGAGIGPWGSDAKFLANGSTAWQVFSELVARTDKGALRVYTGTDASLGSVGGAPGVDIATLFGVATTRVQGDFDAIQQGLNTGLYQPWCAINVGDSRLAPSFEYQLPDPDADTKSKQREAAEDRVWKAIANRRANGCVVNQDVVDQLCQRYGVEDRIVLDTSKPAPPALPPTA